MKRHDYWILCTACVLVLLSTAFGTACAEAAPALPSQQTATIQQPLTWEYLATIAGAAAFTLMVVQFTKAPLDKVWKIPTRLYAYIITLAVMMLATAFTASITLENALLVVCNALVAALAAYGAYEVTFAKRDRGLADTAV